MAVEPTRAFHGSEATRVAAASQELWGTDTDGVRLPLDRRTENLHEALRDSALGFFEDHGIKWWTSSAEPPGQPTSLLRSSQLACVNHLEPARLDAALASEIGWSLGLPVEGPVSIDGGFLTYEWIGTQNYLSERRWGRRGERCTSLDAFLPLRLTDGRLVGIAIEWKYTEIPKAGSEVTSTEGTSRVETYWPLIEAPDSPIAFGRLQSRESLFVDPYTQLLRQTLLASQIAKHRELGIDDWLHVHVVPADNQAMRRPIAKLIDDTNDLDHQWRGVLNEPDRYRLVTPTELLAHTKADSGPLGWREWLALRYAT